MKRLNLIVLLAAAGIIFASCEKHETVEGPNPSIELSGVETLREMQKEYVSANTQTFSIDASSVNTVTGALGTQIYFSGNNFVDQNGNPLTGNVDVSLIEIYNPLDMILMNKTTLGDNAGTTGILSSGGEFKINFTQNGNPVTIANDVYVTTAAPNTVNPNMSLFGSDENANGEVFWNALNDPLTIDTATFSYVFAADTDFTWINCDYFWNFNGTQIDAYVDLPTGFNETNTHVYAAFPNESAAAPFRHVAGEQFGTTGVYTLPSGIPVTYVAISAKDNILQYAFVQTTVTPNTALTNFTSANDLDEIRTALAPYF